MSSLPDSLQVVLFGATGDLARSKLLPSLLSLTQEGRLNAPKVLCLSRRPYSTAEFVSYLATATTHPLTEDLAILNLEHLEIDLTAAEGLEHLWAKLNTNLPTLYFFAMPPEGIAQALSQLTRTPREQRPLAEKVILDKPYGDSLTQTQDFIHQIEALVGVENLFLNDHYLYKDMVQALAHWRNTDLHNLLQAQQLTALRLVVSEQIDLGTRASYFDGRGMSVDWFQSHMLQMLATACTMSQDPHAKTAFISSLGIMPDSLVRAQYTGYTQLPDVDPKLQTETFLAVKLKSSLPDWQQVVFHLVAGKALAQKQVFLTVDSTNGTATQLSIDPPAWGGITSENLMREYQLTIEYALLGNHAKFVSTREAVAQWQLTEQLRKQLAEVPLQNYAKGALWQDICGQGWC